MIFEKNENKINRKKGMIFTTDALFALLIVSATVPLILALSATNTDTSIQTMSVEAESSIEMLSIINLRNVIREPVIYDLYSKGMIGADDLNKSAIDFIAKLWASNTTENLTIAQNITSELLKQVLPPNYEFTLYLENDSIYDTGGSMAKTSSVGRRVASGYLKGSNSSGYIANMFLNSIGGKKSSSYYFLGGFVGQGNISFFINDIPEDASVEEIYVEVSAGSDFSLLVNDNDCGVINLTSDPVKASINGSCLSYINPGGQNRFNISFSNPNITYQYFGGGFFRVTFETNELVPTEINQTIIELPGIDGIINYFGSFYVNGHITAMELRMHFWNNYSTYVNIGNVTVFNTSGNFTDQNKTVTNSTMGSKLKYDNLSFNTIPVRIGVGIPNITAGDGIADVILITDTSGSMDWNFTCLSTSSCGDGVEINNCSDPNLFSPSTRRISIAKCLDKNFISIILNNTGNRVGLVGFSSNADNYVSLTNNPNTLVTEINSYSASGATCVACAINRAYSILASQSSEERKKFIVTMSDGVANVRAISTCNDLMGIGLNSSVFTGGSGGEIFTRNASSWYNVASPTTRTINGIDMINSTFGFSVASSGVILKWNGTSWASMTSPVSSSLYGVDIYNSTFAIAVGSSGRVLRYNGSWSNPATLSNSPTLYSVSIYNTSLMFASGTRSNDGKIYKSVNNGSTWTEDYSNETAYRGVKIINRTLAFAVGDDGDMLKWNGTAWKNISAITGENLYGIESYNSTYTLAVGGGSSNSVILKYNGVNWSVEYTNSGNALNDAVFENGNISYVAGDSTFILEYNGSWSRNFDIARAYRGNNTSGTDCSDPDTCFEINSFPALNANYSSCRSHTNLNATVHSVGFGPVSNCTFAANALMAIAKCGNGTYYSSSNTTGLEIIYRSMAEDIVTQTYTNQTTIVTKNVTSKMYPDSYLIINYTQDTSSAYQEIATYVESERFSDCNYTFFVPSQLRVDDAKITSFSGPLWTSNASINSSAAGGQKNIYLLSNYGTNFQALGDPFIVNIPPSLIKPGENNTINIYLGISGINSSIACPSNSTLIYRARFRASVSYGSVFSDAAGGIARIYYDIDHDGVSDGYIDTIYGENLTNFDPTIKTIDQLDPEQNALDDALIRLLEQLNFVITPENTGIAGSQTNPIDIKLSDIFIDTTSIGGIPYSWGPIDIKLGVRI